MATAPPRTVTRDAPSARLHAHAALQVARIHHIRVPVQDLAGVDMAQRPVLVAMVDQLLDRAGA
ncbi:hypothetical protein RAA17_11410 [Komagataeibacter rhaeticus]|nr:hypothetical protein [Komagataeibacter rhaeticus]